MRPVMWTKASIAFTFHAMDVRAIRTKLGMTQQEFAGEFGFSVNTLRHWEQGKRQPEGPTRAYLLVIDRAPDTCERCCGRPDRLASNMPQPRQPRRQSHRGLAQMASQIAVGAAQRQRVGAKPARDEEPADRGDPGAQPWCRGLLLEGACSLDKPVWIALPAAPGSASRKPRRRRNTPGRP